jgi:hypothetical protein
MAHWLGSWLALLQALAAATGAGNMAPHGLTTRVLHLRGEARATKGETHPCSGSACQLLVRIARGGDVSSVKGQILVSAEPLCLHYIPHDSFVGLFAASSAVQELEKLPSVESVQRIDPALKIAPALVEALASPGGASQASVTLDVLCCACQELSEQMERSFAETNSFRAALMQASESKVFVQTSIQHLNQTASWLTRQERVFFLDVKQQATLFNYHTSRIIKDEEAGTNVESDLLRGLNGEDEVVGVADTGQQFSASTCARPFCNTL